MTTREQAMTALLALLSGTGDFVTVSRRNRAPESIGPALSPALFLVENSETYQRKSPAQPPVRRLTAKVVLYNDVGTDLNAIPATAINDALDQLDAALQPDDRSTGRFTLGGLVFSAMIDGEIEKAPGDVTGKSMAVVPIEIILP